MTLSNDQRMADWLEAKPYMWNLPGKVGDLSEDKVRDAVLGYLLRSLSRGRVPHLETLLYFLEGKAPLASCGFIGCWIQEDHVH